MLSVRLVPLQFALDTALVSAIIRVAGDIRGNDHEAFGSVAIT